MNRYIFSAMFCLLGTLFLVPATVTAKSQCAVKFGDRWLLLATTCAEFENQVVAGGSSELPPCVDLPIIASPSEPIVDFRSSTEVYLVIRREKLLLASDEAQESFNKAMKKAGTKFDVKTWERSASKLLKKNGIISKARLEASGLIAPMKTQQSLKQH